MSETFAIGERVIIDSGTCAYVFDRIALETPTRWVCASGKWFDKKTLRGPRPKSMHGTAETLLRATDRIALRRIFRREIEVTEFRLSQATRQTNLDIAEIKKQLEALTDVVKRYEEQA